jgi:cytochrome P450
MVMTQTLTAGRDLFAQVLDPASRHDPYPLYARLRETPVSLQEDGTYAVSGYPEVAALLHDPRVSSDERKSSRGTAAMSASGRFDNPPFIFRDPPDHDRLRRLVMRLFTPERIAGMHDRVVALVAGLLDAHRGHGQIDIVDNLAYPLPVTVICELLGVPREDEPRFFDWASALARSLDPPESMTEQEIQHAGQARAELREYLSGLAAERRAQPRDDLISGLAASRDRTNHISEQDLISTLVLLLVAGHETTVNLITNGMLTLLRHPDALERLRREPDLITPVVEEVLRFDPPVQFRTRTILADLQAAGVTIPQGATVALLLASGSRDPRRFPNADQFIPDRTDNQHFGFGGGIHYCVGAPLARIEAPIALGELARRLTTPRLLEDPPPYRENAALRGPRHLQVTFDRLAG